MKASSILVAGLVVMAGQVYAADFSDLQSFKAGGVAVAAESMPVPQAKAAAIRIESRISEFPVYSSQSEALPMARVCQILERREANLGKTTAVRCINRQNGVIELVASDAKTKKVRSILANMNDRTVIEYVGSDYAHYYKNNLGQQMVLNLSFVHTGEALTWNGVMVKGWYRADLTLSDNTGRNRFGYFSGVNY